MPTQAERALTDEEILDRISKMTLAEALKFLDDEQDKIKQKMANTLIEIRRNCRSDFADRVEKHMLENDLLPRGPKAN